MSMGHATDTRSTGGLRSWSLRDAISKVRASRFREKDHTPILIAVTNHDDDDLPVPSDHKTAQLRPQSSSSYGLAKRCEARRSGVILKMTLLARPYSSGGTLRKTAADHRRTSDAGYGACFVGMQQSLQIAAMTGIYHYC
jgi:hypothetical protein